MVHSASSPRDPLVITGYFLAVTGLLALASAMWAF